MCFHRRKRLNMRAIPAQTRRHLRDIRSDTNLAVGPTLQALDTGKRQKPFRLGCMGNMDNMGNMGNMGNRLKMATGCQNFNTFFDFFVSYPFPFNIALFIFV